MSTDDKDILTGHPELSQMPFRTPEGYFESVDAKVRERIRSSKSAGVPLRVRLAPLLAAAAMFAVIATVGISLLTGTTPENGQTEEEYLEYLVDLIPVTEPESIYYSYNPASGTLSNDDIVNYLLYSGVTPEELSNN